jgi:ankyrin repeat protein
MYRYCVKVLVLILVIVGCISCKPNASGDNTPDGLKKVKAALEEGADPNLGDQETGYRPLDSTVLSGDVTLTKALLDKGADPNLSNKYGTTPLETAAFLGNKDVALLLKDKAQPAKLKDAASFAKFAGHDDLARELDPAYKGKNYYKNYSPLQVAAEMFNDPRLVDYLVKTKHQDIDQTGTDESNDPIKSAVELAFQKRHYNSGRRLVELGAKLDQQEKNNLLLNLLPSAGVETYKALLDAGADINAKDKSDLSLIDNLIRTRNIDNDDKIIKFVLSQNPVLSPKTIQSAIDSGVPDSIDMLLEREPALLEQTFDAEGDSSSEFKSVKNCTPIAYAMTKLEKENNFNRSYNVIKALRDKGADLSGKQCEINFHSSSTDEEGNMTLREIFELIQGDATKYKNSQGVSNWLHYFDDWDKKSEFLNWIKTL